MLLRKTKRVSNCAPRKVGNEVTLREPKARPSGSAPAGTGLDSVNPFCHSCETCTAANGVTANQPQACFHPASMRPLRRLLPMLASPSSFHVPSKPVIQARKRGSTIGGAFVSIALNAGCSDLDFFDAA